MRRGASSSSVRIGMGRAANATKSSTPSSLLLPRARGPWDPPRACRATSHPPARVSPRGFGRRHPKSRRAVDLLNREEDPRGGGARNRSRLETGATPGCSCKTGLLGYGLPLHADFLELRPPSASLPPSGAPRSGRPSTRAPDTRRRPRIGRTARSPWWSRTTLRSGCRSAPGHVARHAPGRVPKRARGSYRPRRPEKASFVLVASCSRWKEADPEGA